MAASAAIRCEALILLLFIRCLLLLQLYVGVLMLGLCFVVLIVMSFLVLQPIGFCCYLVEGGDSVVVYSLFVVVSIVCWGFDAGSLFCGVICNVISCSATYRPLLLSGAKR